MLPIHRPDGDDRPTDEESRWVTAGTAPQTLDDGVPDQPHVQQSAADAAGGAQLLDDGLLTGL